VEETKQRIALNLIHFKPNRFQLEFMNDWASNRAIFGERCSGVTASLLAAAFVELDRDLGTKVAFMAGSERMKHYAIAQFKRHFCGDELSWKNRLFFCSPESESNLAGHEFSLLICDNVRDFKPRSFFRFDRIAFGASDSEVDLPGWVPRLQNGLALYIAPFMSKENVRLGLYAYASASPCETP